MLDVATAWVNDVLDVDTLEATTDTVETFNARVNRNGEITLRLRNRPVTSISQIRYRTAGSSTWTTFATTDYDSFGKYGDTVVIRGCYAFAFIAGVGTINSWDYRSPLDRNADMNIPLIVEVTYSHGYASGSIPANVKQATIIYASHIIHQRGSSSITMDGNASTIGGSPFGDKDLETARELLRSLKRVI